MIFKHNFLLPVCIAMAVASPSLATEIRCEAYCVLTETHPIAIQGYSEGVVWSRRYYADAKDSTSAFEILRATCKEIGGNKLLGDFKIGRSKMMMVNFLTSVRIVDQTDCRPVLASGVGPNGEI